MVKFNKVQVPARFISNIPTRQEWEARQVRELDAARKGVKSGFRDIRITGNVGETRRLELSARKRTGGYLVGRKNSSVFMPGDRLMDTRDGTIGVVVRITDGVLDYVGVEPTAYECKVYECIKEVRAEMARAEMARKALYVLRSQTPLPSKCSRRGLDFEKEYYDWSKDQVFQTSHTYGYAGGYYTGWREATQEDREEARQVRASELGAIK